MLLYHLNELCKGILFIMLFAWLCAAYAFYMNSRRLASDPEKKDFYFAAVFLAPLTFLPLLLAIIFIFIVRALFYGLFLLLFIFALIFVRKPFILEWLKKNVLFIGNKLMEANTLLIRLFLQPWAGSRGSA